MEPRSPKTSGQRCATDRTCNLCRPRGFHEHPQISNIMSLIPFSRLLLIAATPALAAVTGNLPKEHLDFFENKIRPILKENCYKCHSLEAGKAKGGLTLDTRDGWEKGIRRRLSENCNLKKFVFWMIRQ